MALSPKMPRPEHLDAARAAYQRYGAVTEFKNFQGNAMPAFHELPFVIQCAWCAAATTYQFNEL